MDVPKPPSCSARKPTSSPRELTSLYRFACSNPRKTFIISICLTTTREGSDSIRDAASFSVSRSPGATGGGSKYVSSMTGPCGTYVSYADQNNLRWFEASGGKGGSFEGTTLFEVDAELDRSTFRLCRESAADLPLEKRFAEINSRPVRP